MVIKLLVFLQLAFVLLSPLVAYPNDSLSTEYQSASTISEKYRIAEKIWTAYRFSSRDSNKHWISVMDSLSQVSKLDSLIYRTHRNYGITYSILGEKDAAYFHTEKALAYYREQHKERNAAYMLRNLAVIDRQNNQLLKASFKLAEAMEIFKRKQDSLFLNLVYQELASVYYMNHDYKVALKYALKAYNYYKSKNQGHELAVSASSVGLNLVELDSNALPYFQEAYEFYAKKGYLVNLSKSLHNIGVHYSHARQYDSALYYLNKSAKLFDQTRDSATLVFNYTNLAAVYLEIGNADSAIYYAKAALSDTTQSGSSTYTKTAYHNLYKSYKKKGLLDSAIITLEGYVAFNKNQLNRERLFRIEEIKAQFELDQKESENQALRIDQLERDALIESRELERNYLISIALLLAVLIGLIIYFWLRDRKIKFSLQQSYAQIDSYSKDLESMNDYKKHLLKIISHDLRGPLGSIQSMLDFLPQNDENSEQLSLTKSAAFNAMELLDNLLTWANSQENKSQIEITRVELKPIATKLAKKIDPLLKVKNISLKVACEDETHAQANINAFETILRNLISNSAKFGSNGDTIITTISKEGSLIRVSVDDEGKTIPEPVKRRILSGTNENSTHGTSSEEGVGLGLRICFYLIKEMGGELSIANNNRGGTTFSFTLNEA